MLFRSRWQAARPVPGDDSYTWYAVLWPAGPAGGIPVDELVLNGPESELLLAVSEPYQTP